MIDELKQEVHLKKIIAAYRELNAVLTSAYQYDLEYKLSIGKFTGVADDNRTVVGLEVFTIQKLFSSDGDV